MKYLSALVLSLTLSVMVLSTNAFAGNTDPLFVNLTTNDTWRSYMALTFSRHQLDKGHPVTIFLNDHGVFLASKKDSRRYFREQKLIHDIVAKGGVVLSCGMCMHKFVIKDSHYSGRQGQSPRRGRQGAFCRSHEDPDLVGLRPGIPEKRLRRGSPLRRIGVIVPPFLLSLSLDTRGFKPHLSSLGFDCNPFLWPWGGDLCLPPALRPLSLRKPFSQRRPFLAGSSPPPGSRPRGFPSRHPR